MTRPQERHWLSEHDIRLQALVLGLDTDTTKERHWLSERAIRRSREDPEVRMKKPAKHTSPDWTEMSWLELGINPSDQHQLLNAVTKDIAVAHHGAQAAKRRVAAYDRAQRAWDRQVKADKQETAQDDAAAATDEHSGEVHHIHRGEAVARIRHQQGIQADEGEGKPIGKSMPALCPLCGVSSPDEMPTYLQRHAPAERCQHCGDQVRRAHG
jgi:hypothetical protein